MSLCAATAFPSSRAAASILAIWSAVSPCSPFSDPRSTMVNRSEKTIDRTLCRTSLGLRMVSKAASFLDTPRVNVLASKCWVSRTAIHPSGQNRFFEIARDKSSSSSCIPAWVHRARKFSASASRTVEEETSDDDTKLSTSWSTVLNQCLTSSAVFGQ